MEKMNEEKTTRKIQTTGGSTLTISLPKRWADRRELNPGDKMEIKEQKDHLIVKQLTGRDKKNNKAVLNIRPNEKEETINRKILNLYLKGNKTIKIKSENEIIKPQQKKSIKKLVRNKLVGTEITLETMEEIKLKTLISHSELTVKGALRRMHRVASSMHENSMLAVEKNDKKLAESVIELDDEVDRFQLYIIREVTAAVRNPSLIPKIGLKTTRECLGYRLVSNSVERAADHARKISNNVIKIQDRLDNKSIKKLKEMSKKSIKIFKKGVNSFVEQKYKTAEETIRETKKLRKKEEKINEYLSEEDPKGDIRIRLILESIRRIAEYGSNIAEISLNLTDPPNTQTSDQ